MLLEAQSGTRAGRPRVLALLTAGLLSGALALAWLQVQSSRAVGPPRHISGTPLHVRLPRDWKPDPKHPQRFLIPIESRSWRSEFEFERRIQFTYKRLPHYEPLEELLRRPELGGLGSVTDARQARIGGFAAVELHQTVMLRMRRMRLPRQIISRFTCLPRGHLIKITYEPLTEFRPADADILDQVCASLQIDDPTLNAPPQEYLQRAGLVLPAEPDWCIVGPDFAEVAGVYIGGALDNAPTWSLAVFRTWLAADRSAVDLVADVAAHEWFAWDRERLALREQRRPDGALVATCPRPPASRADTSIVWAAAVAESASRAAVLTLRAAADDADRAIRAAERIAAALRFAPLDYLEALPEAAATGVTLAQDLRKRGPAPRWGRESVETIYRHAERDEAILVRRKALQRDPSRGYEGAQWHRLNGAREERLAWTIDGRADTYQWQADVFLDAVPARIVEQRARTGGDVSRQVFLAERPRARWEFTPGPAFVPPPVDSVVEGWVARLESGVALVEASSMLGSGTHSVLLRSLPSNDQFERVLVQHDYSPAGVIRVFDDARAEVEEEIWPDGSYRRAR